METETQWRQRANSTKENESAWRFDHLLIADRGASFRNERIPGRNHRTVWPAYEGTQNSSSRWWWEPIRRRVLKAAHVEEATLDIPSIWKDWKGMFRGDYTPTENDLVVARQAHELIPVVITYISRQKVRRRLTDDDDWLLVDSLEQLAKKEGWEFNNVHMQDLTSEEQLRLMARTTVSSFIYRGRIASAQLVLAQILLGVHGNGLTHLVWMPLTPLTTVIEIFYPKGFAKDYEWTSRALGGSLNHPGETLPIHCRSCRNDTLCRLERHVSLTSFQ